MRQAVRLAAAAHKALCTAEPWGARVVLSLFFRAVLGVQRMFHFSTLHDVGFALLTGGVRVLSRSRLGLSLRRLSTRAVLRFCHATQPPLTRQPEHLISLDDHAIPRFTKKFRLNKGYHTIRNKFMPIEKLLFSFHVGLGRLLQLGVGRGNDSLLSQATALCKSLLHKARGAQVRLLLDAAAAQDTAALLDFVSHPHQVTLVRVPRRQSYLKHWQALPASAWQRKEEPGPFVGAPAKVIHLTETVTLLRDVRSHPPTIVPVRTVVVREQRRCGKERWHALWAFSDDLSPPYALVQQFRLRQGHEQRYRVLLHDAFVDAAPSGYNKRSPHVKRPGFRRGALQLYAWLSGMASDALDALSQRIGGPFLHAMPRTLRRYFLNTPAEVYQLPDAWVVLLHITGQRPAWEALVAHLNRDPVRIPWAGNRKLILALAGSTSLPISASRISPFGRLGDVWC